MAALAVVRVVQIGARYADQQEQADRLSRALVVHGLAMLVLAATALVFGTFPWFVAIFAGAWGATWLVVGRAYDPSLDAHDRQRQLEATMRDERPLRARRFARRKRVRKRQKGGSPSTR